MAGLNGDGWLARANWDGSCWPIRTGDGEVGSHVLGRRQAAGRSIEQARRVRGHSDAEGRRRASLRNPRHAGMRVCLGCASATGQGEAAHQHRQPEPCPPCTTNHAGIEPHARSTSGRGLRGRAERARPREGSERTRRLRCGGSSRVRPLRVECDRIGLIDLYPRPLPRRTRSLRRPWGPVAEAPPPNVAGANRPDRSSQRGRVDLPLGSRERIRQRLCGLGPVGA